MSIELGVFCHCFDAILFRLAGSLVLMPFLRPKLPIFSTPVAPNATPFRRVQHV